MESPSVEPGIESCCDPRRISEHVAVALRFDAIPANRIWPRHPSHIADQFEGRGPSRTYESGTGIRSIEVYYGHLNARTGGPSITDPLQKKSYDAVSAANPFAIDPAKITVEPGVSYLPSPIKLDGHAAGVVANAVNGNCNARRTSYEASSARLAVGP